MNLVRTLTATGIGSHLGEILSTHLYARCEKCDIQVTSDEIEQVSLAEDATKLSHPKLKRLRLGCCAREGCEAVAYRIYLEACPGVDWEIIAVRTNELMSAEEAEAKEEAGRQTRQQRLQRTKRAALGLLIVVFSFLLLFAWRHGRLPFVKKPHKYEIDPASVGRGPQR